VQPAVERLKVLIRAAENDEHSRIGTKVYVPLDLARELLTLAQKHSRRGARKTQRMKASRTRSRTRKTLAR
jgi:hypothetical protein